MNERINQFFYLFLAAAIGFLSWGLLELNKAGFYRPPMPIGTAINRYSFDRKELVFPLDRYQSLLSGDLFFGKLPPPPPTPPPPQVEFKTQIIVIGITCGSNAQNGYAVVGLKKFGDGETWIVNPGQAVGGERVVSIHNGYIMVKNETGVGKVPLRD